MNLIDFTPKQTQIEPLIRKKLQEILTAEQLTETEQIIDYRETLEEEARRSLYRDGKRERSYTTLFGAVTISKQRFRGYSYSPFDMGPYQRRTEEFDDLIEMFYTKGLSTRETSEVTEFLNAPISRSTVSRINQKYDEAMKEVNTSSLEDKTYSVIFADAKYHPVRVDGTEKGHVSDRAIIILLGLNEETGYLELLHLGVHTSENYQTYKEIFESLSSRGLKETPILGVNDGQRGLIEAFMNVFPLAFEQLCVFHKIKNRLNQLNKPDSEEFRQLVVEALMNKGVEREEALKNLEAYKEVPGLGWRAKKVFEDLETSTLNPIFDVLDEHKILTSNVLERLNGDLEQRLSDMFALPNETALQRICTKRALDYLKRREEYLDPELLKLTRQCYEIFTEILTNAVSRVLNSKSALFNEDLSGLHSPILSVDIEEMPFVFSGSILKLKFIVSRLQSAEARERRLIGVCPAFSHSHNYYETALEELLERNLSLKELRMIQCSQDQGPLVEAVERVFKDVPIQIDASTLEKNILRELPKKYEEAFKSSFEALVKTNSLSEAQLLLESLSQSLNYHNLHRAREIFQNYAPKLLTAKKLGFKNPQLLLDCSQARIKEPTKKFKALSDPLTTTRDYLDAFEKASFKKKGWLCQDDLDILFEKSCLAQAA